MTASAPAAHRSAIKALTYMMFMMFALTTESVGLIIPEVMRSFHLGMTASGAFHYAPMTAIALAGIGLGFLADRLGRKRTIILGLCLFALNAYLFALASSYAAFLALLTVSGVAIGIFKTGALALIGDISRSAQEHTTTMNTVEGFFGLGSIIGPAIVARLLLQGVSWKWIYVIAGAVCTLLVLIASRVRYPETVGSAPEPVTLHRTARILGRPIALGFSLACFLYVALECSIYVWLPTYLASDANSRPVMIVWSVPIFFALRAGGRFLGAHLLARHDWTLVLLLFSGLILACFAGALLGGIRIAAILLTLSGLFMSVIYPTLNSKGISCFHKSEHGAVAGVILFFSCAGAGVGPLAMGAAADLFGNPKYCFVLATLFAALLFAGLLYNWLKDPTRTRLRQLDRSEYDVGGAAAE
jgi:fucose permease